MIIFLINLLLFIVRAIIDFVLVVIFFMAIMKGLKILSNSNLFSHKGNLLKDWFGDSGQVDDYINGLLKDTPKEFLILWNLKKVKEKVEQRNYSLIELKLLKSYFITAEKSLSAMTILTTIIAFFSSISVQILRGSLDTYLKGPWSTMNGFDSIFFVIVTFILVIIYTTKGYKMSISRVVMFKEIIDICIEEKEKKEKKIL